MTDLGTEINIKEAKGLLGRIDKGIILGGIMASTIGEAVLEFENRRFWSLYENDDGTQRYKSCAECFKHELTSDVKLGDRQIRRLISHAKAERNLFGRQLELKKGRKALPERVGREFAKLNDSPDEQKKAFGRLLALTNGKLIPKVAKKVVAKFVKTPEKKIEEIVEDPGMKRWILRIKAVMDGHIRVLEDEADAPEYVLKKFQAAAKALERWDAHVKP